MTADLNHRQTVALRAVVAAAPGECWADPGVTGVDFHNGTTYVNLATAQALERRGLVRFGRWPTTRRRVHPTYRGTEAVEEG